MASLDHNSQSTIHKLNYSKAQKSVEIALKEFADTVYTKFNMQIKGEPEDQIRGPFEVFIKAVGVTLDISVNAIGEILLENRLGRPDYAITINSISSGFVELKAPKKGALVNKFKGHDKDQWERFRSLPNILYTDGIEWALYRTGEMVRSVKLSGDPCVLASAAVGKDDVVAILAIFTDFFNWKPIVPTTAKQLSFYLAPLCRMLKNDVLDALNRGSSAMHGVASDWRRYLFPDADNNKFADSYAQTVTFALLLARTNGADTLLLDEAINSLTTKNSLLGRALQVLTDDEVRDDVAASLDMLQRVIHVIPSHAMTKGKRDPWLHFYEDFLQEYDPKLRKDAGAYYTPLQVVHAQTLLVEAVLRTKMDKPMGYADHGVETLDPAVGTGTYLLSIIDLAMKRVIEEEGIGAAKGRASLLGKSLYGFELMVGPYAVAALRMTRLLQDYGGGTPADGAQIFLSNTLESPYELAPELPMMYRAIGLEHRRAKRVKESVPVMVCIGNPPYNRHEKATKSNVMSTGAWVRWGENKTAEDAILNDFIEPVKKAGKGGQLKSLYNLYIYFWRWGLWKVFEQEYAQSGGIVSFITASSFIDGDAFMGMRQKMRQLCDEIWVIDLGGDGRGTKQDENVFDIQTPVAITIAVRYKETKIDKPADIYYTKIEGTRATKLAVLEGIKGFENLDFEATQSGWLEPFLPKDDTAPYFSWAKLTDLMPWQHSGAQFKRSWPISPTKELLEKRWNALLLESDRATAFKESRDRKITSKVFDIESRNTQLEPLSNLNTGEPVLKVGRYGYRSFDRQYTLIDNRVADYIRPVLWQTTSNKQLFFASLTTNPITAGAALTVSSYVPDLHYFRGSFGAKDIIPLYRDAEATLANIHPELLPKLETKLCRPVTPDDWACYLYGVMAGAKFASEFASEISSKDVRVPITLNPTLFEQVVELGKQLLFLHSFGDRFTSEFPRLVGSAKCQRSVTPNTPVTNFSFNPMLNVLYVGDGEFYPVTEDIWNFEVSGLKVLQSWLGYRMANRSGKKSSPLDFIGLSEWTPELTTELLQLLKILENTLDLYPKHAELLAKILSDNLLTADCLSDVPDAYRKAPKFEREQEDLNFE